jgi:hypothetical protein
LDYLSPYLSLCPPIGFLSLSLSFFFLYLQVLKPSCVPGKVDENKKGVYQKLYSNRETEINGNRETEVNGNRDTEVNGNRETEVNGNRETEVDGNNPTKGRYKENEKV